MKQKFLYFIFLFQAFILNFSNVVTPKFLDSLYVEKYLFGYFIALWSFGMMISSPIWGSLGRRYGKKNFVLLGIIIYGISQSLFYYVSNVPLLFLLRVVSGIGVGAIVTLLLSHLILNTDVKVRSISLGHRMAAITFGNMVAYKLGGYLGLTFTRELFLLQGVLSIVLFLLVLVGVSESKKKTCVYPEQHHLFSSIKHIKKLDKSLLVFLFSLTLATMSFVNIDKFIDLFLIDQGHSENVVGNVKLIFGLTFILTNMLLVPKIKKYLGKVYVLQTISIIMGIIILFVFMHEEYLLLLSTFFLSFMVLKGIYTTSEQLFMANLVEGEELSVFMGFRQSFTCLGMIIGPIIGGHLYHDNEMNVFMFTVICLLISSILLSYIRYIPEKSKELNFQ